MDKKTSPLLIKYLKAYDANPKSKVFAPLAETYRKMGMVEEAMSILNKGIRFHPDYPIAYLTLAQCYADRGAFENSYSVLRPIVANHLENILMQKVFALSCLETKRLNEALDAYHYILYLNPKDQEAGKMVKQLEEQLHEDPIVHDLVKKSPAPDLAEIKDDQWQQVAFQKSPEKVKLQEDPYAGIEMVDFSKRKAGTMNFSENKTEKEEPILPEEMKQSLSPHSPASLAQVNDLPIIENKNEQDSIMITLTLAEIYKNQGYYKKAIEVLHKFKLLGHDDQQTNAKIQEIEILLKNPPRKSANPNDQVDDLINSFEKNNKYENSSNDVDDDSVGLILFAEDEEPKSQKVSLNTSHANEADENEKQDELVDDDLMKLYDQKINQHAFTDLSDLSDPSLDTQDFQNLKHSNEDHPKTAQESTEPNSFQNVEKIYQDFLAAVHQRSEERKLLD
jgi:tetratricopeptide (TPR) repeat protein